MPSSCVDLIHKLFDIQHVALPEFAVQNFRKNSQSPARNKFLPGIIWVTSVFQARDPILIGGESYDGQGEGAE